MLDKGKAEKVTDGMLDHISIQKRKVKSALKTIDKLILIHPDMESVLRKVERELT